MGTQGETQYVEDFAQQTVEDLHTLRAPHSSVVYSAACYTHHITETPSFYTVTTTSGVSQSDALDMFLKGELRAVSLVDDCHGFNCGGGCNGNKSSALIV